MDPVLNIVVVEDHDALREITVEAISSQGHNALGFESAEALQELSPINIDLMVVDLNLPGEDGINLVCRLKRAQPQLGVIMVTARGQITEKMEGYASGADIYLAKPVALEELVGAIGALARRIKSTQKTAIFCLCIASRTLQGPSGKMRLTAQESAMLVALARAPGNQLEYWQLLELQGKSGNYFDKVSLESPVSRLRLKFKAVGASINPIQSIRNCGYRLSVALSLI